MMKDEQVGKGTAEPHFVSPMLAKLVNKLPEGRQWGYEVKFDGYRVEAIKDGVHISLFSRRGSDFTKRFSSIAKQISGINAQALAIDGEVVVVDDLGRPSFQGLQHHSRLPTGWKLAYFAFDLLHLNGKNFLDVPLAERRRLLQRLLKGSRVLFSETLYEDPEVLLKVICQHQLEGIVAKRQDSVYEPGKRSGAWQKLPVKQSQRFVIGGYRPGLRNFEVLLVGYYERDQFLFAGKVTQGLRPGNRAAIFKLIKGDRSTECYFSDLPRKSKGPFGEGVTAEDMNDYIWVLPKVVAEVRFAEWTRGGVLRHAQFARICEGADPQK